MMWEQSLQICSCSTWVLEWFFTYEQRGTVVCSGSVGCGAWGLAGIYRGNVEVMKGERRKKVYILLFLYSTTHACFTRR
jgi:hypothetical protein